MAETKPAWTVTGQQETTGQLATGAFAEGVKVTFMTAAGVYGSVFVPRTEYSTARVAALVDERARAMAEVSALKG
jgi:hypothetical protein